MQFLTTGNPSSGWRQRLTIKQGETVALGIQFFEPSGVPLNITGYTLKAEIAFPTPLLLNTSNGGITINNPITGMAQMNIPSASTAAIPKGSYSYDLWLTSPNGSETPWMCGNFALNSTTTPVP